MVRHPAFATASRGALPCISFIPFSRFLIQNLLLVSWNPLIPPTSAGAGHVESAQIAIRIKKKQLSGERVLILVAYKMSSILVKSEWPSNRFAHGKFTPHDT